MECVKGHELGVGAVYAVEGDVTIHGGDKGVGAWRTDEVVALREHEEVFDGVAAKEVGEE